MLVGGVEESGDLALFFDGGTREGELGEVREVDSDANAAVAATGHKRLPHPGLAQVVEIGG